MPSARARLETVAAPSFSSRSTTDTCDAVRSLWFPVFAQMPFNFAEDGTDLKGEGGSEFGFRRKGWTAHFMSVPYIQVICKV